MEDLRLRTARAVHHAVDLGAHGVEQGFDDGGVGARGREDEAAGIYFQAFDGVREAEPTGVNEIVRNGGVKTLGVFLGQVVGEDIVARTGESVAAHAAVVGMLIGGLTEGGQSDDDVAGADACIVDHIGAAHAAGYGAVDNDRAHQIADVGDLVRTIIVDSTVTCRMRRADVIDNARIRPGDVIVGLASFGQATYEHAYNGGMGSNGLTSARHDVFAHYLAKKYPESFDAAVPDDLVYAGGLRLTDAIEGLKVDAGRLVLSPTRTYAPVVKALLDAMRPEIHGMVHCSGGAQTKILHFIGDDMRVVKDNLFPLPPLFRIIREQSGTDWAEMYKVFNMGHRMEVYLDAQRAEEVIALSGSFGIDARIVGRVESAERKELIIRSEFGEFRY